MTTTMRNSLCAMTMTMTMTMTIMEMAKAKISCSILLLLTMTTVVKNVAVITVADAAPLNDLIIELPDYGRPPTPHFSGYLDASAGCDTDINGPICKIHYWLALAAEEEEDDDADSKSATTATKPTVLWLNGGPGSSSLLGWLQEIGPLLLNATGGLMNNPYSWTNAGVNLLVIEQPMGVGFSYCSLQKDQRKPCINSDTSTAKVSSAALVDFFTNKFPELSNGPFYISGESYAGVYIPTLSKELLEDPIASKVVPLKGIMVGDPCTDNDAQRDSMDSLWYSNKYGLMDADVYETLMSDECDGTYDMKTTMMLGMNERNFTTLSSKSHQSVGQKWSSHVTAAELNAELNGIEDLVERRLKAHELYNERVLGNTNSVDDEEDEEATATHRTLRSVPSSPRKIDKCKLAHRKFMLSSSHSLSQGWNDLYIDDYSLFAPVTSKEDEQMATYLNRKDVRKAIHVEESPVKKWPMDNDVGFSYNKQYKACNWQPFIDFPNTSMIDIYQEIIPQLDRTWIYNGDTDPCVSYEGTREAVKQILLPEVDGGSYRPWFYNQTATSMKLLGEKSILFGPNLYYAEQSLEKAQFGGEVVDYDKGLSFITFHGSGHMVPQFRPQAALHFLQKFVHGNNPNPNNNNNNNVDNNENNKNFMFDNDNNNNNNNNINNNVDGTNTRAVDNYLLSPLLKSNETLTGLTDIEFEKYILEWTESAMTAPYVGPVD